MFSFQLLGTDPAPSFPSCRNHFALSQATRRGDFNSSVWIPSIEKKTETYKNNITITCTDTKPFCFLYVFLFCRTGLALGIRSGLFHIYFAWNQMLIHWWYQRFALYMWMSLCVHWRTTKYDDRLVDPHKFSPGFTFPMPAFSKNLLGFTPLQKISTLFFFQNL